MNDKTSFDLVSLETGNPHFRGLVQIEVMPSGDVNVAHTLGEEVNRYQGKLSEAAIASFTQLLIDHTPCQLKSAQATGMPGEEKYKFGVKAQADHCFAEIWANEQYKIPEAKVWVSQFKAILKTIAPANIVI